MVFKRQKWRLAFSKFHNTILAFKTPKCDMFINNIGVYNAKKRGILNTKKRSVLYANIWHFKRQNWCLTFMKWTPDRSQTEDTDKR